MIRKTDFGIFLIALGGMCIFEAAKKLKDKCEEINPKLSKETVEEVSQNKDSS